MAEDATPQDATKLRAALLAGGAEATAARKALLGGNGTLRQADFAECDLAARDLSDLDLQGADFFGADLSAANLKMAKLTGAELAHTRLHATALYKAELTGAILLEADLEGADLSECHARGADFRGARLANAKLCGADLRDADFSLADLSGADLSGADIGGARMTAAQIDGANVSRLRYGGYRKMSGLYNGIRGVDQTFGNALFVRDAKDQDYIDTLGQAIQDMAPGPIRMLEQAMFRLWGLIDHGRSLLKVWLYALGIATLYGLLYLADMSNDWGIMDYSTSANTWFTPFYYSVVTYTTLGYGDVTADSLLGEMLVVSEVVIGYFTLGLLLAILANTIARRS